MHIKSVQRFNILFSISFNFFILIYTPQMFVTLKSDISWGRFKYALFAMGVVCVYLNYQHLKNRDTNKLVAITTQI